MCENRCARRWAAAGTLVVLITLLTSCSWAATVLRVDFSNVGGGDGSSWAAALNEPEFRDVLRAVTPASGEVEFWVAKGVYRPGTSNTDSFVLSNDVALYGGFAGTETTLVERNPSVNLTVLTGDIDGNDANKVDGVTVSADNIMGTNSLHVVTSISCDITAILDGFTVCGGSGVVGGGMVNSCDSKPSVRNCVFVGNAAFAGGGMANVSNSTPSLSNCTFSGNRAIGGGIANLNSSSPSVTNCTFSGNGGSLGGGIYSVDGSSPSVIECTFSGNVTEKGGGMANINNSTPTVTNCTFLKNEASEFGAGIYNHTDSNSIVTNCTFSENVALNSGGGMVNVDNSTPSLSNCTFSRNTAKSGGGMLNSGDCSPRVTNCTFSRNSGGGMVNYEQSNPSVSNCTFSRNVVGDSGGGMGNFSYSNPRVTNCTFSRNEGGQGGGMINGWYSGPVVTNCTFSGNVATAIDGGGGMANIIHANPTVTNCIFWDNMNGDFLNKDDSTPKVTYSIVEDISSPDLHVISENPFLSSLADNGGFTWTMAIDENSPARDAGTVSSDILPATVISLISRDQRGEMRDPQDTPDVGAYEYKGTGPGPSPAPGGGGGGCSVGFAPAVLFLALPLVFLRR